MLPSRYDIALCVVALTLAASLVATPRARGQSPAESAFRLEQNVPNPFTPGFTSTIIAYRLDRETRVELTVYNLLAQEVAILVDRVEPAGRYVISWDGLDENGDPVPAGIYWYKLQAGDRTALKQMRVLEPSPLPGRPAG